MNKFDSLDERADEYRALSDHMDGIGINRNIGTDPMTPFRHTFIGKVIKWAVIIIVGLTLLGAAQNHGYLDPGTFDGPAVTSRAMPASESQQVHNLWSEFNDIDLSPSTSRAIVNHYINADAQSRSYTYSTIQSKLHGFMTNHSRRELMHYEAQS